MTYTDVFGGNLIFPSRVSYLAITTAVDVTLQWPTEQQITGDNVVADIIDTNTTAGGLNIDMPDARNTSLGNKATFNNVGANTFTVRDNTGGTIQSVQSGEQWVIVLTDNSTQAGTWTTFLLGGNAATPASASVLAGDGLRADGAQLDQIIDSDVEAATPFTVVSGDRAKCLIYTAGAGTCNLPSGGDVGIGNAFFVMVRNSGSGTLNIVPAAGTIDGSASLNLDPNGSTFIFTDGTDWFTIGLTVASTIAFDFVSIAVPGSGDFVLSGANLDRISYRFTGALTGNRRIVVPNTTQQYWVDNQTTGAFTLEIDTAAGAGQTIPQNESAIVYCDATDIINAVSSTSVTFPITIGQGGTNANNAADARTNLGAAFDGRLINSGAGLAGGGDLTADRTLILDINSANTTPTPAGGDFLAFEDIDDNLTYKATIDDILAVGSDSLVDSAGNVRAFAATGSVLQLRSDGNSDVVPRILNFTHQDQTVRGRIGWDSFSEEFVLENLINAVDADIEIRTTNANTIVEIQDLMRITRPASVAVAIAGSANNNAGMRFVDTSFLTRFTMSFPSSDDFTFAASLTSASILFTGVNSITATRTMLELDPNLGPRLFVDDGGSVEIARPLTAATGGFEVNNTLTGAGFERVLTEGDLGSPTDSGSFTVDFSVGFTGSNVTTFQYLRFDNFVIMWIPSANLGTSNANTCGTSDGIPVSLRPDSVRYSSGPVIDNASAIVLAQVVINTDGSIDCFAPDGATPPDYGNDWTTSGVKGPAGGFTLTYGIND